MGIVQRAATRPALLLVEATRCRQSPQPPDDCETLLLDLWLLDNGKQYRVLQRRGPLVSDTDFKSGTGRSAVAWMDLAGRRYVVVDYLQYHGGGAFSWKRSPTVYTRLESRVDHPWLTSSRGPEGTDRPDLPPADWLPPPRPHA